MRAKGRRARRHRAAAAVAALLELQPQDCRFPIGDPRTTRFRYCGERQMAGSSYCEAHHRRAYQPTPVREQQVPRHKVAI